MNAKLGVVLPHNKRGLLLILIGSLILSEVLIYLNLDLIFEYVIKWGYACDISYRISLCLI